jgi:hypothetical protein
VNLMLPAAAGIGATNCIMQSIVVSYALTTCSTWAQHVHS